jgi:hypothetical protein
LRCMRPGPSRWAGRGSGFGIKWYIKKHRSARSEPIRSCEGRSYSTQAAAQELANTTSARGTQKKRTGLDVVGWFLRGQKSTRAAYFWDFLWAVFEFPLPRNNQKCD